MDDLARMAQNITDNGPAAVAVVVLGVVVAAVLVWGVALGGLRR